VLITAKFTWTDWGKPRNTWASTVYNLESRPLRSTSRVPISCETYPLDNHPCVGLHARNRSDAFPLPLRRSTAWTSGKSFDYNGRLSKFVDNVRVCVHSEFVTCLYETPCFIEEIPVTWAVSSLPTDQVPKVAEVRARARVTPCGICGGPGGTGRGYSPSFPRSISFRRGY
jgi:hypothetical protein